MNNSNESNDEDDVDIVDTTSVSNQSNIVATANASTKDHSIVPWSLVDWLFHHIQREKERIDERYDQRREMTGHLIWLEELLQEGGTTDDRWPVFQETVDEFRAKCYREDVGLQIATRDYEILHKKIMYDIWILQITQYKVPNPFWVPEWVVWAPVTRKSIT